MATAGRKKCGAFLVRLLAEGPELHVKLRITGKLAVEAIKKACDLIGADLGAPRIFAYIPLYNLRMRMAAIAAGAKRIGKQGVHAFYVKELTA